MRSVWTVIHGRFRQSRRVTLSPTTHINEADRKAKKVPNVGLVERKCECRITYYNVINYTVSFDSAAKQVQLINHRFKKDSVTFDVKSQCSAMQSGCTIRIALEIGELLL